MGEMIYEDKMKFIGKLTQSEVLEVLEEAKFHHMSTEEWLNSSWCDDLRRKVMEREQIHDEDV